jgi:hypothetical protein
MILRPTRTTLVLALGAWLAGAGCSPEIPIRPADLAGAQRVVLGELTGPERRLSVEERDRIVEIAGLLDTRPMKMNSRPVLYTASFIFPDGKVWKVCVTSDGWFYSADGQQRRDTLGLYQHLKAFFPEPGPSG